MKDEHRPLILPFEGDAIHICGAKENNLANIDATIPRRQLVAVTGLSGSGKSSLAFDTIYAEGQRRYIDSLSAYARQFLGMSRKPDVESIEGLSPAIAIEQKTTSKNPRSTVGTVTEIHDYLRLLFARVGIPHSPSTGLPIESQTIEQMVDHVLALPEGYRFLLLAPVVRERKGEHCKTLEELRSRGFSRLRIDKRLVELGALPKLDRKRRHSIDVVVDRLIVHASARSRLADSLEIALGISDGIAIIEPHEKGETLLLSTRFACPVSGFTIESIEPRLFSFNAPAGACPSCEGLGSTSFFDPDLIVPDPGLSLDAGAIAPWSRGQKRNHAQKTLEAICDYFRVSTLCPFRDLPENVRLFILYGASREKTDLSHDRKKPKKTFFEGVIPNLERCFRNSDSSWIREELSRYQNKRLCEACQGYRLKPEALAVKINHCHIAEITQLSIKEAGSWILALSETLAGKSAIIAAPILRDITARLGFLVDVGLDYLTLDRSMGTLSGGESQRIRLASQIGSGLTGVLYVLDEPSIGLHQRDNDRLIATLQRLRELGNTVIVVEHDEDAIRAANWVIDMGPGAGKHGGQLVAAGPPEHIEACTSLTGDYLSGRRMISIPKQRRPVQNEHMITLKGARAHNLADITVKFPLGLLTCVTGVSGSGKSSLVIDTLYAALACRVMGKKLTPGNHDAIEGIEQIDKVIDINQQPIGRTPRSNPITYIDAFTPIRNWYAQLPQARERGYQPGRFSFNVRGGRCEACEGGGAIKVEMHFLPDVYVPCEVCQGKRYDRETLDIKFKDHSIADILNMTAEKAAAFFQPVPAIHDKLKVLCQVGLGYVRIGQSATTLSGGEAQRIKLSKELARRASGRTFYILDEPTTGLHFEDVRCLLDILQTLVDQGNTIIIIEHNMDVIKVADWLIDLGPGGGHEGGQLIAAGTPEDLANTEASCTGYYLRRALKNAGKH